MPLDDLTPQEVAMLGHALRMVPSNACLTAGASAMGSDKSLAFFHELAPFRSLWEKTAEAIRDRADLAPFRATESAPEPEEAAE